MSRGGSFGSTGRKRWIWASMIPIWRSADRKLTSPPAMWRNGLLRPNMWRLTPQGPRSTRSASGTVGAIDRVGGDHSGHNRRQGDGAIPPAGCENGGDRQPDQRYGP